MKALRRILLTLLALVFLVEAWIWDKFSAAAHALADIIPFQDIKTAVARFVSRLPPYVALALFVIPALVVLPFKIAGLWLIAHGHFITGGAVFLAAKVAGVGVAAFLFELTRDKLMTLAWFARFYAIVMGWRDWAHKLVDPYKAEIKARMRELKARILHAGADDHSGFGRMVWKLRERIRRSRLQG